MCMMICKCHIMNFWVSTIGKVCLVCRVAGSTTSVVQKRKSSAGSEKGNLRNSGGSDEVVIMVMMLSNSSGRNAESVIEQVRPFQWLFLTVCGRVAVD